MAGPGLRGRLRDLRPYRNAHLMRRALDLRSGLSVLEIGGGTGRVAAAARLEDAVVLDRDAGLLSRVDAKRVPLQAVRGEALSLPFADGAFDRISMTRTFHHLADPEAALVEAKRVLADDGRIVVEEVIPSSLFGRVLSAVEGLTQETSFRTPKEMKALLERIDLECKVEKWSPSDYAAIAVPAGTREPPDRPGALA